MREANEILISSHSEHIYNFGTKPYPAEQSPLAVTRAFGAQAPPKLVLLGSPEPVTRQQHVQILSTYFAEM